MRLAVLPLSVVLKHRFHEIQAHLLQLPLAVERSVRHCSAIVRPILEDVDCLSVGCLALPNVAVVVIVLVEFQEDAVLVLAQLFQGWSFEVSAGKINGLCGRWYDGGGDEMAQSVGLVLQEDCLLVDFPYR